MTWTAREKGNVEDSVKKEDKLCVVCMQYVAEEQASVSLLASRERRQKTSLHGDSVVYDVVRTIR